MPPSPITCGGQGWGVGWGHLIQLLYNHVQANRMVPACLHTELICVYPSGQIPWGEQTLVYNIMHSYGLICLCMCIVVGPQIKQSPAMAACWFKPCKLHMLPAIVIAHARGTDLCQYTTQGQGEAEAEYIITC